jgi:hypothetical protein
MCRETRCGLIVKSEIKTVWQVVTPRGELEMKALSPLSQEYIAHMTEEEWRDLYKRLRLFSYKKYGMLQTVVGGLDLESVILDSIEDTFFGVRRWPVVDEDGRIKNISLCVFLCQTIRSKVRSGLINSRATILTWHDEKN